MRILGLDPGFGRFGWGVIDYDVHQSRALAYGCSMTDAAATLPHRLVEIYRDLEEVIEKYHPEIIAVESLFFQKNVTTAMGVAHARGVALLQAGLHNIPVAEYTPSQVKQAVTGVGNAPKSQVQAMVSLILRISHTKAFQDDAADALAVAITAGALSK